MERPALKNIKRILVINLGGIGDVLLSFPALRSLREAYKEASFDVLAVERVAELFRNSGFFDNIFLYKKGPLKNGRLLSVLRKNHYDLAVNMRTMVTRASAVKMLFLMSMIAPRIRAGRDTDGHGSFFDIKIPETLSGDKHEMEYDIDMARALGASVTDKDIGLKISPDSLISVEKILQDNGISEGDCLVGINPGGAPAHRWPMERFAAVANAVALARPCSFVLTGDRYETEYAGRTAEGISGKVINLAGKLNLQELGALIKRCDLYISNDTGPMHIAASLKRPLIAIFGPGYLKRFDPRFISKDAVVFHKPVRCAPCDKRRCIDRQCLDPITSGEVAEAAIKILVKR